MKQFFHAKKHRERSQPIARSSLGLLEKHKDYKIRAQVHHKKQETLKILQKKARLRNPDEFYFGMIKAQLVDGIHTQKSTIGSSSSQSKANALQSSLDSDQQKLAQTQDLAYIRSKLVHDQRRIERLQKSISSGIVSFQGKKKIWNDEEAAGQEQQETINYQPPFMNPSGRLEGEIQQRKQRIAKLTQLEAALSGGFESLSKATKYIERKK